MGGIRRMCAMSLLGSAFVFISLFWLTPAQAIPLPPYSYARSATSDLNISGGGTVNWVDTDGNPYFLSGASAFAYRNSTEIRVEPAESIGNTPVIASAVMNLYQEAYGKGYAFDGTTYSRSNSDLADDPSSRNISAEGNSWYTRRFTVSGNGLYNISTSYWFKLFGDTNVSDPGAYPIYAGYIVTLKLTGLDALERKLQLGDGVSSFDMEFNSSLSYVDIPLLSNTNYEISVFSRASSEANQPVPIPGTLLLFGSGVLGLVGIGRKRQKN